MAKLGKRYFTRGKVMIGVEAFSEVRPGRPFNAKTHNVSQLELTKMCEGINQEQADKLLRDLQDHFVGQPAIQWMNLTGFVDLADTRRFRIINQESAA